jgi:iron complex transport system substrate-binding protein
MARFFVFIFKKNVVFLQYIRKEMITVKRNERKTKLTALLLALALSLTGCAGTQQSAEASAPAAEGSASAVTQQTPTVDVSEAGKRTEYPLTITTYNYEQEMVEYTVEKAPERVLAIDQNNIEILLALGLGDKIVGAFGLDGEIDPDLAEEFSKINYQDTMFSKEDVLALEPDFIAGWYSTFSDKRLGDVDFWQERGVGTYMSLNSGCRGPAADNPRTVEEELQDILNLGIIFDKQETAEALVENIRAEVEKVTDYLADKERLTVAVLEDEGGSYRVYGEDVLGGQVAIAGGGEVAVGKHGETGNISAEDLVAANPDAIFMVWYDEYTVNGTDYAGEQVVELITENPVFASLDAVQNGRIFAINLSGIYCSGLHTLDGILDIATNLYPELYQ